MKREHASVKKRKKWRKNEGPDLFPTKMNILLGLENQSSHSQKDLHQPFRMNPNNNQNTWGGRIKNLKEEKNTMAQFGFKYTHDCGKKKGTVEKVSKREREE